MTGRFFIDSNVLVYPHDRREPEKAQLAIDLLGALALAGGGLISAQVLGEFFWAVTRRLPDPLSDAEGAASVGRHARTWDVLDLTWLTVREALRGVKQHQLPYWDGLIWGTARLAGVPVVLSEDFTDGREVEGVVFRNPFREGFALGG
jgi:predicted nucleic acid-binding protein